MCCGEEKSPSIHPIIPLGQSRELVLSWCLLGFSLDGKERSLGNGLAVTEVATAPEEQDRVALQEPVKSQRPQRKDSALQRGHRLAGEESPGTPLLRDPSQEQQLKLLHQEKLPQGRQSSGPVLWESWG